MGDKSPKDKHKKSAQKQTEAAAAAEKKRSIEMAKQVGPVKK